MIETPQAHTISNITTQLQKVMRYAIIYHVGRTGTFHELTNFESLTPTYDVTYIHLRHTIACEQIG